MDFWHINAGTVSMMVLIGTQFTLFLRWIYRQMRDDEVRRVFLKDVATNHLPHIYHALRAIAVQNGIVIDDPPPVRFIEFNGRSAGWVRQ